MGYKCDRCQANFFPDPLSSRCQQCPACYGLVKDEVQPMPCQGGCSAPAPVLPHCPPCPPTSCPQADRLKARLQEMEEWLQKPGCDARPDQSPMLGDVPRGDGLPSPYLLQGMGDTPSLHLGGAPHHPSADSLLPQGGVTCWVGARRSQVSAGLSVGDGVTERGRTAGAGHAFLCRTEHRRDTCTHEVLEQLAMGITGG